MRWCLGFMMQNEAHWLRLHLPVMLQAAFDGIVALDGGSKDDSVAYVESLQRDDLPVHIFHRPFDWHFSHQANALLEAARTAGYDAMLRIDPDECMFADDVQQLKGELERGAGGVYIGRYNIAVDRRHYRHDPFPDEQLRVFRLDRGYQYHRRVHEVLNVPAKHLVRRHDIFIFHYGLIEPPAERALTHFNYDRLWRGQTPVDQLPDGYWDSVNPKTIYPNVAPFRVAQPIDPDRVGRVAPFREEDVPDMSNIDDIQERINSVKHWYQRIEIGGVTTPGVQNSTGLLKVMDDLGLPQDMSGLRVLDIGAGEGFFSFACEKRGAEVVAIDRKPQEGFTVAAELLGSELELTLKNVYDLHPDRDGRFDVVFLNGLLYHLRHPQLAFDIIRGVMHTDSLLFVETHLIDGVAFLDPSVPKSTRLSANVQMLWQLVPALGVDDTCCWFPSLSGLQSLFEKSAFEFINGVGKERCVAAGRAVDDSFAAYRMFTEFETMDIGARTFDPLLFRDPAMPRITAPTPRRSPKVKMSPFTVGELTMLVREGRYNPIDKGVMDEVQHVYYHNRVDYTKPNLRAIDIGAHIGAWTSFLKIKNPTAQVHAVEPATDNFEILEMNTETLPNVSLSNAVVAYGDEPYYLAADPNNSGGHIAVPESQKKRWDGAGRDVYEIPIVLTLENIMGMHGWDTIDIVKCDAEGAEFDIFINCAPETLRNIGAIVGEYHGTPQQANTRLFTHLRERGFELEYDVHPDGNRGCFLALNLHEAELIADAAEIDDDAPVVTEPVASSPKPKTKSKPKTTATTAKKKSRMQSKLTDR